MRLPKDTEKLIRSIELKTNADADEVVLGDSLKAMDDSKKQAVSGPSIWRIIMTRKSLKLAAAVVIIIATMIGIYTINGTVDITSRVYGMPDIPQYFRTARTLRTEGYFWLYDDPNSTEFQSARRIPLEQWVDLPNLRQRDVSYIAWQRMQTGKKGLERVETVLDGNLLQTDINHTRKEVRYSKGSVLNHRLRIRQSLDTYADIVHKDQLVNYKIVGTELIDGTKYDIWECHSLVNYDNTRNIKSRCWISPQTGDVARMYTWSKPVGTDSKWLPSTFYERIERNIRIEDEVFSTDIPEDYKRQNSPETARVDDLMRDRGPCKGPAYATSESFTLTDGTVIVAFESRDRKDPSNDQGHLFENLRPGGPLPKTPVALERLKFFRCYAAGQNREKEYYFEGRHLTFTTKNDRFYEWAIYVPTGDVPPKLARYHYTSEWRHYADPKRPLVNHGPVGGPRLESHEFAEYVLDAMKELSDESTAPNHITYDYVINLASQVRRELAKQ